jgi:hypothetical protein
MKRVVLIRKLAPVAILMALMAPFHAYGSPQTAQQMAAGKITTLIPAGSVVREKKILEAKKDMPVFWLDTVKTDRGGRARLRLEDGSILNVGSQASLVVTKHDPGKQQTDLDLIYGKVRADVTKIATPDGHFEIRTKVAVCGVVGTQEYIEANDLATTVIALGGGQVRVSSVDPRFAGSVLLEPGETVSFIAGRAPGTKRLANPQELLRAVQDTEGESGATIDPGTSVAGRSFDAVISGKNLNGTRAVSFSQPGLTIKTRGEITATQIPVTITVGADVPAGAYPITIDRPQGPAVAGFAVASLAAVQTAQSSGAGPIQLPPETDYTVTRGAKVPFDASTARSPSGTQIVAYQWTVANTGQAASGSTFSVNTSSLQPGNYTVQLTVVNDQGRVATQQYRLVVEAGTQPVEIVRDLASAYESLQPSAFLKNFDEERFRNYAGFASAVEDSFRSKLETMRVFQRPVNCAVVEQQDQGVCQAEFQLQFTLKSQPSELLDADGNPIPPGTTPPPNATLGKRVLKGSEQDTIRFERANSGWKVVDYAAVVSCPNGGSTAGINVGSCVFAAGSSITPTFQLVNLQLFSSDLSVGGSVSGSFTVQPVGGFTSSINLSGQGQIGNQSVTVQFSPNPSGPSGTVGFTVFAPSTAPAGLTAPTPFTLVLTGRDTSGAITATANATLTFQPDFNLVVTPATTSSSPAPVTQNSTLPVTVQVTGGAGTVRIDFPNPPVGFSTTAGNVPAGGQGSFPITVSAAALPGPALLTVRGTLSSGAVKTTTLFVNVISDFTLNLTPASSQANPAIIVAGGTLQLGVQVVPISGFAGTVTIDFPNLPAGFTATGGDVAAGATVNFPIQNNLPASNTVFQITVRGRFGTDVQSILLFVEPLAIPGQPTPVLQASVYAVEPAKLTPGVAVEGKLYGTNLSGIDSVLASGSGIKIDVLASSPTELRVRFTADRSLQPGSRVITLQAAGRKAATSTIDIAPASKLARATQTLGPAVGGRRAADLADESSLATATVGAPDLLVSSQDFTMTPVHPKPGDTVLFHIVVRNAGTATAEDAAVEFSIAGTGVRQREKVTLAPGDSESLEFEWKASGSGSLKPGVVIDPESRLRQASSSGKTVALQAFQLDSSSLPSREDAPAKLPDLRAVRQKGELSLAIGSCIGFRLTSGTDQSCGGSADFEVTSRPGQSVLVMEAEGIRNLGGVTLDQAQANLDANLSTSAALVAGNTYLVKSRRGIAVMRIVQVRGIESVRNAPPAVLRGPRMGGSDREVQSNSTRPDLTLVLEWKVLQQ